MMVRTAVPTCTMRDVPSRVAPSGGVGAGLTASRLQILDSRLQIGRRGGEARGVAFHGQGIDAQRNEPDRPQVDEREKQPVCEHHLNLT